jgi:hypothetical protein
MKKRLTIINLLAGALGVYAQGQIDFTDYVGPGAGPGQEFEITVYGGQVGGPVKEITGNGPSTAGGAYISPSAPGDLPGGTQTSYTEQPLGGSSIGSGPTAYGNGNNYTIQLFAAPGANAATLYPITGATSTFYTFGAENEGQFTANEDITLNAQPNGLNGIANGATGTFQLRAWYSGGGVTSYAEAIASGVPDGEDNAVNITLNSPPNNASSLNPLTSFNLVGPDAIPEPSTIILGVVGSSALLFRRRINS